MKEIIDSPFSDGEAHLKSEKTTSVYRKEKFSYIRYYYVCDETGLEFTEDETDEATFSQIYGQYREKYGIPPPEQLTKWRKSYGLSSVMMSKLLGLGENQYGLYEKGEMPALSIGRLLSMAGNKDFIEFCIEKSPLNSKGKMRALRTLRKRVFGNI